MPPIAQPERQTQDRVIRLFQQELHYRYLGDWSDRPGNANVEEQLLTAALRARGYAAALISRALDRLRTEANNPNRSLYDNNRAVYQLLRYGIPVKPSPAEPTETVWLIDWQHPTANDFAIAEEVTLFGHRERRPDVVLYLNGLAVGVLELKKSSVEIGEGIRQSISNQSKAFNEAFFSTIQLIFAGSDSQGLRYGTIGTEDKYFLTWKEDEADDSRFKLDKYLLKLCDKTRLLELLHDFVLFDGGQKKLPRVHQYFGIKAAQQHVREQKGGIIWHTQGSGKSIVMVLLAKWILENQPTARVVIITDRDELDKQIERVFADAGEAIKRTGSGRDLMYQLGQTRPRLLCSLVHKFGKRDVGDFEAFIQELAANPVPTVGDLFVFVDECHRTQSGKLHRTMKTTMPNAVFIGFTGTPLLKQEKETSLEVFGGYIHTYKFGEAVQDQVVLDLVYEARNIEQELGSPEKIDAWFDAKTRGLNEWQRAALREQWGTMQQVLSSRSRMGRVVADIAGDFGVKTRLSDDQGTAMLVALSIYEACRYYDLFQQTPLRGKCAVITSYNPSAGDITLEDTGAPTETAKEFIYHTYETLLQGVVAGSGQTRTEAYEASAKNLFRKQPARMKLLIVVHKLLTGFDAPSCTYLYIDKSMRDHDLFQAICRTNRLDGETKDFGYIVDYKDLFQNLVNDRGTGVLQVYSSELDHSAGGASPEVLLQERLKKGRERLDAALEALALLCEPVAPPKGIPEYIRHLCGNTELADDLKTHAPQRVAFYKATATLVRAYANIADDLATAGYAANRIGQMKAEVRNYVELREAIRNAAGEKIDLKAYEADMRHLIDTYIEAAAPRKISAFDDIPLLQLIVDLGLHEAIETLPEGIRKNRGAIAETIANNVRSKIIKDHLNDPAFYDRMSVLLDEIIADLRARRIDYEAYLRRIAAVARDVQAGTIAQTPARINTPGKRALYHNLEENEELAVLLDEAIKYHRPADWRGVQAREQAVKKAMYEVLKDVAAVERLFPIIETQVEY